MYVRAKHIIAVWIESRDAVHKTRTWAASVKMYVNVAGSKASDVTSGIKWDQCTKFVADDINAESYQEFTNRIAS